MVNPRMRKCQAEGCTSHATFKVHDQLHPTACANHKVEGMVHVSISLLQISRLAGQHWHTLEYRLSGSYHKRKWRADLQVAGLPAADLSFNVAAYP